MRAHLESFCRRAIVRRRGAEAVEEVTCHSIGTVFCPPTQRNRGYATGLMRALAQELQELRGVSNLYSDIGAEFYARHGWHVYSPVSVRFTQALPSGAAPEIAAYAEQDCERVVQQMQALPVSASHVHVAILPEACVYAWHFARARFECSIVHGSDLRLEHFGAALADGSFLAWTYDVRQGTVVVLRAAVESQESLLALTAAAMEVGRKVGFNELVFWNPPFEQALIAAGAERVVRTGSLPSLCVFGEEDGEHVEWLLNEKFPWV
ncbi:hypothetical protein DL89DRAFT_270485 [Linderina pennispora]|uniref:LYC1 C-terminal domain-containing protein n=1 Tax=Linderina pennispora TaxID=61395 RepID=A0A1Y1VXA3_9FUNG|nr:uncharacterized protein DL89DRAFT_270485 [Linderina pennispora]ORX65931.1 hypothetical protein DL89DRAFT_270485 [Linderina pennispora]